MQEKKSTTTDSFRSHALKISPLAIGAISAYALRLMVAFRTAPPYAEEYASRSVPPPAKPSRSGALARIFITVKNKKKHHGDDNYLRRKFIEDTIQISSMEKHRGSE